MRSRLCQYESAAAMSQDPDGLETQPARPPPLDLLCDVSQNIGFGSMLACVPTLTRGNQIWSLLFERLMLPLERLEAMGIPAILPESTVGLDKPFGQTLETLSAKQINELTGNSMQIASISAVLLYVLAHTELIDNHAPA